MSENERTDSVPGTCTDGSSNDLGSTTRLTFTGGDATETELVDDSRDGQFEANPVYCNGGQGGNKPGF
jgi:hypothetical protein